MKLIHFTMLFMIVVLVGCGSNSTNNNNNDVDEHLGGSQNIIQDDITVKPDPTEQKDDIANNNGYETEPEQSDGIALDDDSFIALFYGEWSNKEDQSIVLELQESSERVGIKFGELLSQSEFSVIEVNVFEQFIVIQGQEEVIDFNEDEPIITPFTSKLYLKNGREMLYIYDYLGTPFESEWVK